MNCFHYMFETKHSGHQVCLPEHTRLKLVLFYIVPKTKAALFLQILKESPGRKPLVAMESNHHSRRSLKRVSFADTNTIKWDYGDLFVQLIVTLVNFWK